METIQAQRIPARQEPVAAEDFIGFLAAHFETERELFDLSASVYETVLDILAQRGEVDVPTEIGMLSSFVLLEMCLALEERFSVTIADEEADRFYREGSLGELLALVKERRVRPVVQWNDLLQFLGSEIHDADESSTVSDIFWPVFEQYEIDIDVDEIPAVDRIATRDELLAFLNGKIAAKPRRDCRSRYGARWSTEARMRTRDMLRHPADSRWGYIAGGGIFKHILGGHGILLAGFSPETGYLIIDAERKVRRQYSGIEELIEDGWVVD